jgi:hypothetical protein
VPPLILPPLIGDTRQRLPPPASASRSTLA